MSNPNKIKIVYYPNLNSIKFYLYEDDECVEENPECLTKYSDDMFELSYDTLTETFFRDMLKIFNIPKVNVVFSSSAESKIFYDLFKMSVEKFNSSSDGSVLNVLDFETLTDSTTIKKTEINENGSTDDNENETYGLTKLELKRIEQSMNLYYGSEVEDLNKILVTIESIFQEHKNNDYVLSCYLPIFIDEHCSELEIVEKLLKSLDSDLLSVMLAFVDFYLLKGELNLAEKIVSKAVKKYSSSILAKCYKVLVLLGVYCSNEDFASLKEAETIACSLSQGNTKLECSWVVRIGQLLQTRKGNKIKQISDYEIESRNLYKRLFDITGGYLVGFNVYSAYSKIQDAINCSDENGIVGVTPGKYKESLLIDKKITLIGEDVIVCVPSYNTCKVCKDAEISGIRFTNDETITNEEVISEIEKLEFKEFEIENETPLITITAGSPSLKKCYVTRAYGGGISIIGSAAPKIEDCIIYNNMKFGISCEQASKPEILSSDGESTFLRGNSVGILCNDNSEPTITEISCIRNDIGVQVAGNARVLINKVELENNNLGIRFEDNSKGKVENCEFTYNIENDEANLQDELFGLLVSGDAHPVITDCKINGFNYGICIIEKGNPDISKCFVFNNKIAGLLIGDNASGKYKDCSFKENYTADKDGKISSEIESCGISISGYGKPQFDNCKSENNFCGIKISDGEPEPHIKNCNFNDNNCGIFASSGNPEFRHISAESNRHCGVFFAGNVNGLLEDFDISHNDYQEKDENGEELCATGLLLTESAATRIKNGKIISNFNGVIITETALCSHFSNVTVRSNVCAGENLSKSVKMDNIEYSDNEVDFYNVNASLMEKLCNEVNCAIDFYTMPFQIAYNGMNKLNDFLKKR